MIYLLFALSGASLYPMHQEEWQLPVTTPEGHMSLTSVQSTHTQSVPSFIKTNEPLASKNWFKTGGTARFYCEPHSMEEFQQAVSWANTQDLPLFVLGEGANILISDEGFDGLVIRPLLNATTIVSQTESEALIQVESGSSFHALIAWALEHHLGGIEEFSGIPGTVGGAVYMNIHYFEFLLHQFIVSAQIIHKQTGTISTVDKEWFNFGYDYSKLHEQEYYLLSATFKLKKLTPLEAAYAQGRRVEIIRHRKSRYPQSHTCGSFFRNFLDHEVTLMSAGKKLIYVAYYLDKIGVKGQLTSGDAIVSYQHANMIVNRGSATSQDIINLTRHMQELVYAQFHIIPQPECQLIGFKTNPYLL